MSELSNGCLSQVTDALSQVKDASVKQRMRESREGCMSQVKDARVKQRMADLSDGCVSQAMDA